MRRAVAARRLIGFRHHHAEADAEGGHAFNVIIVSRCRTPLSPAKDVLCQTIEILGIKVAHEAIVDLYGRFPYTWERGNKDMARIHKPTSRSLGKTARFEARLTKEQKTLFMKAAMLTGKSLTDFIVASAHENASRTVREHEAMVLSIRDREAFVAALVNPPAPSARLRKAARHYRKQQRLNVDAG